MDLAIKGGTVVTEQQAIPLDVGIVGERIVALGADLSGAQVIDASGCYVFPGFIDAHVHLEMRVGDLVSTDDWETGTLAAACGGTTTVIDFTENLRGDDLAEGVRARRAMADGRACVDYSLHLTLSDADPKSLKQLPILAEAGYTSAKVYTTYEGLRLDDGEILRVLAAAGEQGVLTLAHTENHRAIAYLTERLLAEGKTTPMHHPLSRPPLVEGEAANRVAILARLVNAPICVAHLTCVETLEAVRRARARGQSVYAEVCPQHLLLSESAYNRPGLEGAKFVLAPPLRPESHLGPLWKALASGEVDIVSTDHCPWHFATKRVRGRDSFARIPNGAPGIETRVPLLYSEGVGKGRLSLTRFVTVCATRPARLYGLYPRKGVIRVGSDADIVVFDPEREVTLRQVDLHQRVDYCPFEGHTVRGYPRTVLCRGRIIVSDGEAVGEKGWGRFIHRNRYRPL